jgi:AraC-like DNA-binding protein
MNNQSNILVSNTLIKSVLFFMGHLGISLEDALKNTQLGQKELEDVDGYISVKDYEKIFENALVLSNDPFFGLHLGSKFTLQQFGVVGFLLMNSDNFGSALDAYQRFQIALSESLVTIFKTSGALTKVTFEFTGGGTIVAQQCIESFITGIKAVCQELTGRELKILSLTLQYEPTKPTSEYYKLLGVIPVKGSENCLEFSSEYMQLPIINSIPELTPIFENELNRKLDSGSSSSFARKVRRELTRRIGKENINSVEQLSLYFGMSERNFQLKLEQEDTTFRQIHDQVQIEFANRFLKIGSPLAEIAYALGFSESSAFQRAYKRWTGITPGQAREKVK